MIGLRSYQRELVEQFSAYENVLCADHMGLGKTYSAIALDQVRRRQEPGLNRTLIIAPLTGVVDSWCRHIREYHGDNITIARMNPKKRQPFMQAVHENSADFYVMHWDAVKLEPSLQSYQWLHVIADEAHKIKNRKVQRTKALKAIKGVRYKTALTGTPMLNNPAELWSLLDWLYDGSKKKIAFFGRGFGHILKSYWRFFDTFLEYEIKEIAGTPTTYKEIVGTKNEGYLSNKLAPIYIRRTKHDVMPELPAKQYQSYTVELYSKQRRAYDEMREEMITWIEEQPDIPVIAPIVLSQLIRLQQFALALPTLDGYGNVVALTEPSVKLDTLEELLSDTDKQVVVFSQFSKMIDLLAGRKGSVATLTGNNSQRQRSANIDAFAHGDVQVLAATIGAGGQGINLQNADTAVFLDRAWSPADNEQAEDRLHRIGQENTVHIIDIVAEDTVDMGKQQTLIKKKDWIQNVLGAFATDASAASNSVDSSAP